MKTRILISLIVLTLLTAVVIFYHTSHREHYYTSYGYNKRADFVEFFKTGSEWAFNHAIYEDGKWENEPLKGEIRKKEFIHSKDTKPPSMASIIAKELKFTLRPNFDVYIYYAIKHIDKRNMDYLTERTGYLSNTPPWAIITFISEAGIFPIPLDRYTSREEAMKTAVANAEKIDELKDKKIKKLIIGKLSYTDMLIEHVDDSIYIIFKIGNPETLRFYKKEYFKIDFDSPCLKKIDYYPEYRYFARYNTSTKNVIAIDMNDRHSIDLGINIESGERDIIDMERSNDYYLCLYKGVLYIYCYETNKLSKHAVPLDYIYRNILTGKYYGLTYRDKKLSIYSISPPNDSPLLLLSTFDIGEIEIEFLSLQSSRFTDRFQILCLAMEGSNIVNVKPYYIIFDEFKNSVGEFTSRKYSPFVFRSLEDHLIFQQAFMYSSWEEYLLYQQGRYFCIENLYNGAVKKIFFPYRISHIITRGDNTFLLPNVLSTGVKKYVYYVFNHSKNTFKKHINKLAVHLNNKQKH